MNFEVTQHIDSVMSPRNTLDSTLLWSPRLRGEKTSNTFAALENAFEVTQGWHQDSGTSLEFCNA